MPSLLCTYIGALHRGVGYFQFAFNPSDETYVFLLVFNNIHRYGEFFYIYSYIQLIAFKQYNHNPLEKEINLPLSPLI